MSNPFCFTEPISPTEGCVFQELPITSEVVEDLIAQRYCLVVGSPKSGTTSLARAVKDSYIGLLPEALWWDVDLEAIARSNPEEMYHLLARQGQELFPEQGSKWAEISNHDTFVKAVKESVRARNRPLVLFLDHLEKISVDLAQLVVRGVRQMFFRRREERCPYSLITVVMAGSRRLRRQGEGRGSPLNFARMHTITDLDKNSAIAMLARAGHDFSWRFEPNACEFLAEVTDGDKYLLQRIGHDCVNVVQDLGAETVTLSLAKHVVEKFTNSSYRTDPLLSDLISTLIHEKEPLRMILDLIARENKPIRMAEALIFDGDGEAINMFTTRGNALKIRNDIYFRILSNHLDILEAVQQEHQKATTLEADLRNYYNWISSLTASTEIEFDQNSLQPLLKGVRSISRAEDVILMESRERDRQFLILASATGVESGQLESAHYNEFEQAIDKLRETKGRIPCQLVGKQCIDSCYEKDGLSCSWIPLRDDHNAVAGTMVLKGQTLVRSSQVERELMQLGVTLANTIRRRRQFRELRRLPQIKLTSLLSEVEKEICDAACDLLNKPVAMLWYGEREGPKIPLRSYAGVDSLRGSEKNNILKRGFRFPPVAGGPRVVASHTSPVSKKLAAELGVQSWLTMSFLLHGRRVGILAVGSAIMWEPTEEDDTLAYLLVNQAIVNLENSRLYAKNQHDLENSDFALGVRPHELKKGPRAIGGEAEILLDGKQGLLSQHQRESVERIGKYVVDHERLIDKILNAARLDANTYRANTEIIPILAVLNKALIPLTTEIEEAGMLMVIDVPSSLPTHRLDPDIFAQIIENLVHNAIQYGKRGTVTVRARVIGKATEVSVEDQGPGVPAEFQERIFQKWNRGPLNRSFAVKEGHLGLGLYFVARMMNQHGGRVFYDDEYKAGARFVLLFPSLMEERYE